MISAFGVAMLLVGQTGAAVPAAKGQEPRADDIVVTARKPLEAESARKFVREMSVVTDGQLAKYKSPVCPVAIGFTPETAATIEARIRRVATAIGGDVAKPGCTGNVLVFATPDGAKFVQTVRAKYPVIMRGLQPYEIRRLIDRPGPVRAWNITALENEDGRRPGGGPEVEEGKERVLEVRSASIINPTTRQVIDSAAVVIDDAALPGKSAIQVADYVAMRTLARTRVVESPSLDTIMGLFSGEGTRAPPSLTEADLAYMKGLYRAAGNQTSRAQVGQIARRVVRDGKTKN